MHLFLFTEKKHVKINLKCIFKIHFSKMQIKMHFKFIFKMHVKIHFGNAFSPKNEISATFILKLSIFRIKI